MTAQSLGVLLDEEHAEKFIVLLVGAGEQGWESRGPSIQAEALRRMGVILGGIADPDAKQLAWTADRLAISAEHTYSTMAEALAGERFDGVVLCVPDALHEPLTIEALEAGCHVLVEKPMALEVSACWRMIKAAERHGKVLVVGYQYPYMHGGLIELADAGHLDTVFRAEGWWFGGGILPTAHRWNHPRLGVAGDWLGHVLSVVQIGIPARPKWVTAVGWNYLGRRAYGERFKGTDTAEALIGFDSGEAAHVHLAWDRNPGDESIGVVFDGVDLSAHVPMMGRARDLERFKVKTYQRVGGARISGEIEVPLPVQTEDTFPLQAIDWVRAARGENRPRFSLRAEVTRQAILEAVAESILRGGEQVAVPS